MKIVKMSLVAAMVMGANVFAIDNIKVSGDAKLYYYTDDKDNVDGGDLFDKANSAADTALRLGVTGDLLKGVSFGMTANAVSTLGLENNLVSNTWTGAHANSNGIAEASDTDDTAWISELWIATTMGKTTAKVGRMQLDTPLAFSETWSVAPNTFDAAVLINQDLPDTTLVGAWVGKGNGVNHGAPLYTASGNTFGNDNRADVGIDGYMGAGAKFGTFGDEGAYAVAAVNNSFKPLTAQAWYYNVSNVADAYWLQADIDCSLVKGVKIGAQYANIDPKGEVDALVANAQDSIGYSFKLGYEGIEGLKIQAAYSDVDNDGVLKIANTATNNLGTAQSKLYTEAWWNYGYVGAAGAESWNLTAEYAASFAKLGAYFTDVSVQPTGATTSTDMTEITLTASKSFGPLDATLAYVSTDADDQNIKAGNTTGSRYDSLQAYLTLNF